MAWHVNVTVVKDLQLKRLHIIYPLFFPSNVQKNKNKKHKKTPPKLCCHGDGKHSKHHDSTQTVKIKCIIGQERLNFYNRQPWGESGCLESEVPLGWSRRTEWPYFCISSVWITAPVCTFDSFPALKRQWVSLLPLLLPSGHQSVLQSPQNLRLRQSLAFQIGGITTENTATCLESVTVMTDGVSRLQVCPVCETSARGLVYCHCSAKSLTLQKVIYIKK